MNIAGFNIEKHKRIPFGLIKVKGIGLTTAKKICAFLNIDENRKVESLVDEEILSIRNYVEKNLKIGNDLSIEVNQNISTLKAIRCYRGIRHQLGLPARGQRTHANARSARQKRNK